MKLSLVTVCLNSERTIRDTINSVLSQDYKDLEYIIFDGGSTDNTIEVIKSYGSKIKLIEGKDDGIYDAMNQAILYTSGEIVGVINSDDFYTHSKVLSRIVNEFKKTNVDSVYSDLNYVHHDNTDKIYRVWKSGPFKSRKFLYGWTIPHPTFFVKRKYYDQYGLYNTDFKISGDYELLVRFLYKNNLSSRYIPEVLVLMRNNGNSNGSILKRLAAHKEDYHAWKKNEIRIPFYTVPLKPIRKILQYNLLKIRHKRSLKKQKKLPTIH